MDGHTYHKWKLIADWIRDGLLIGGIFVNVYLIQVLINK